MKCIAIAGAGFSGAVIANALASSGQFKVVVFDERDHIAGNCFTRRDPRSNILIHQYGPHIFHTSRLDIWEYMNRFSKFGAYTNRVKAITSRGVFSLPINLLTINQFFGVQLSPSQARSFLLTKADSSIASPKNLEEQALKMIGSELYEAFFYGYTKKQWGVEPRLLPASILQRLPVRFNYDDNYYNSLYQGIPVEGYTPIIEKMLDHPNIEVRLKERVSSQHRLDFDHVFYSGSIDGYFEHDLGRLRYRSLRFERFDSIKDWQGNPVINYCSEQVPFTRITEHKHFAPWEEHSSTVCFREFSYDTKAGDTPYYPLRLTEDKGLLDIYSERASQEDRVTFMGRLGTYRYLDMHVVIAEALDLAQLCLRRPMSEWPAFSVFPSGAKAEPAKAALKRQKIS